MPVDTPTLALDPYKSTVPVVQFPQQDMQPGGPLPLQAGYMGKTGAAAEIGDQILKGFMRGRAAAVQKKTQDATNAIGLSQKNEQNAFQTYQDSLRAGTAKQGDANDPAYQAYIKAHQATSETMEKYAIPEEKPKGQKKKDASGKPKDGEQPQPQTFGGKLADFLKANPHVVPQLAIATRTPNKPVMTAETEQTKNTLTEQQQNIQIGQQRIQQNAQTLEDQKGQMQRATQERQVEEAGGYEKVLKDPNAPPEQQQAARRMKFSAIDKESPEGRMKLGMMQDVQTGSDKNWTPGQRQLAGYLGIVPEPKSVKVTGKNGHEMEVLVDPTTNQPIAGSKPLDLGPPQWAQEFYGERAARKRDLEKSVAANPEEYGVTLTGDKKTDAARVEAAAMRVFTDHEEGIKSASGATGKTAFETSRDNTILSDVAKEIATRIPKDSKTAGEGRADFDWPGQAGGKVNLSHQDMNGILGQFITNPNGEHPGVYTFRDAPQLQAGKDAGAAERDRKFVYNLVRDRMLAQKGKNAMTPQQADAVLANTALGKPITQDEVVKAPDQPKQPRGSFRNFIDRVAGLTGSDTSAQKSGSLRDGPPSGDQGSPAGAKVFIVNGQAFQMTPEEAEKVKAAGYPVEEASPELLQQFSQ